MHTEQSTFDVLDLQNFYVFFKNLYSKTCTLTSHGPSTQKRTIDDPILPQVYELEILNTPLTITEIEAAIHGLKNNKSDKKYEW